MSKFFKIISIVFVLLIVSAILFSNFVGRKQKTAENKVCFGENCIKVEVATTPAQQETGLMNRKSLSQNSGMLFIFPAEENVSMWMKNTLIPLDMIWLDKNKKIVDIQTAEPCKADPCKIYQTSKNSQYVLEINAGESVKLNLKIGDEAKF